jgi:hypothetical protein
MIKIYHFIKIFLLEPFFGVQKYILLNETKVFLCKFTLSGSINCNTFSVVPSIIIKIVKNVLLHSMRTPKEIIVYT